ncbi:MAG: rhombosortase [Pseudomonadales bacterium]|nr:rhombosortase [Pseudomonadales bacterium]
MLLVAAFMALVVAVTFQAGLTDSLQYQRDNFSTQWWRGVSHALPHINTQHLSLNLLALLCLCALFPEAFKSFGWLIALAFAAMVSATGLYLFSPSIEWCSGLSGALHGLMVYAALRTRAHVIWLLAVIAKLVVEQTQLFQDSTLASLTADYIGHAVVVDAHLWGAIGGFMFFLMVYVIEYIAVFIEINSTRA